MIRRDWRTESRPNAARGLLAAHENLQLVLRQLADAEFGDLGARIELQAQVKLFAMVRSKNVLDVHYREKVATNITRTTPRVGQDATWSARTIEVGRWIIGLKANRAR